MGGDRHLLLSCMKRVMLSQGAFVSQLGCQSQLCLETMISVPTSIRSSYHTLQPGISVCRALPDAMLVQEPDPDVRPCCTAPALLPSVY